MAAKKQARLWFHLRWLFLLPIPALWCLVSHFGWLGFLENKSVDWRFLYRGELGAPVNVVYVNVDSKSLAEIGGWPWTRDYFTSVCTALVREAKVKAIGVDFVFSEAGMAESSDRKRHIAANYEFARFLNQRPPVVLAAAYGGWQFLDINGVVRERMLPLVGVDQRKLEDIEPPELPTFELPGRNLPYSPPLIGLIDTIDTSEGMPRWVAGWTQSKEQRDGKPWTFYHMSLELARLHWGLPDNAIQVNGDRIELRQADGKIQVSVPLLDRQKIEINWFSRWYSPFNAHVEFSQVYKYSQALVSDDPELQAAGKEFFAQDGFKNAIVLIGPVDKLLQDIAVTPFDAEPVPKVGVHGNLLKTIISGEFLKRPARGWDYVFIFALTLIVATLSISGGARPLLASLTALVAVGVYGFMAFQLFKTEHIVWPMTAPMGAALTTSFVGLMWQVVEAQKAKGRIKGMFGAYVSPQLVERMVESGEDPQLGGHDAEITAYFSDIQGFSTFSEVLGSGPLVDLMNEYLTACTDIVQEEGGTLDKYIGDAVVAMFGAPIPMPDHAYRACVATQRVHQRIGELRQKWKSEGDRWPEIVWKMQSRIGLNTGVCMIGNMGSRTRFNYTMMGDDVNLAARMESGAKRWGAYTMVTEATKAACQKHGGDRVVFRPLGRIVVMGRSQPVPIHEIVGLKETLPDRARECIALFEEGLACYYACDWDGAIARFRQSAELEPNQPGKTPGVKTNPSLVYIEIAEDYRREPPAKGWDGVYVMKEK